MSNQPEGIRTALVLDHRRDSLDGIVGQLRRTGYDVTVSQSVDESARIVDKAARFDLVVVDPLVCRAGGVEFGLLERLQSDGAIPVILLVDSLDSLDEVRRSEVPLLDFVRKPVDADEFFHRVERAAATLALIETLRQHARDLEGQVTNDHKTDLLSERYFRSLLHIEFKRTQRNQSPLSLLLIDVDNFKTINDTTDYAFGDEVLRAVASNVKQACRETDFPARFGGDEFVVMLPQTSASEAVQIALRLRKRISELVVRNDRYATRVTISIGVDTFDGKSHSAPEELRRGANKALHEAKQRGKNLTWLYEASVTDGDELPSVPANSR